MRTRALVTALVVSAGLARTVVAEPAPVVLYHHGRLLDANDKPVNGNVTLTFVLYKAQAGTGTDNVAWQESYQLTLGDGVYSIPLGDTANGKKAIAAADVAGDRWLAVQVNGAELSPRAHLGSVPHALTADEAVHAGDADLLGGVEAAKYALKTDLSTDAQTLQGKLPSDFLAVGAQAADAKKLAGVDAANYALKTDVSPNAQTLQGKVPGDFLAAGGTAVDSQKLGGQPPSAYLLKSGDTASNLTVNGLTAGGNVTASGNITTTGNLNAGKVIATQVTTPAVAFNGTHVYPTGPRPPYAFVKDPTIILSESGVAGQFDGNSIGGGCVYKEGSTWYLFYGAYDGSIWNGFGLATSTSPTGPFQRVSNIAVLSRSTSSGQGLDLSDLYRCSIIKDGSTYYMYYGGYARGVSDTWRIFLATAPNLQGPWTKQGVAVDIRSGQQAFDAYHAYGPAALFENGKVTLAYGGYNQSWDSDTVNFPNTPAPGTGGMAWTTGIAVSNDPVHKQFTPISLLPALKSPEGRPYIWNNTAGWYANSRLSFGYSAWDRWSTQPGTMMKIGDLYVMFYNGDDGAYTQIGVAYSYDGQTWTRQAFPALPGETFGLAGGSWASTPMALIDGNTMYLYYVTADYSANKNRIRLATIRF